MPGNFIFGEEFDTDTFISQTELSDGSGTGIDDPNSFSAQGGAFTFNNNDANITLIALLAGQTLKLDVDFGSDNNIDTMDTRL